MFKTKCLLLPSIFKVYNAQTQRVLFVLPSFSFWGVSDVPSSFLSLGGKETRKGEWVGRGPISFSVTAFMSDMAPYFLHFYLQWLYVNTLNISEYSAKTVCWTSKSNQEIGNPAVSSTVSSLWLPGLHSILDQKASQYSWIWGTGRTGSDCEFDELQYEALAQFKLSKIPNGQKNLTLFLRDLLRCTGPWVEIFLNSVLQRTGKKQMDTNKI